MLILILDKFIQRSKDKYGYMFLFFLITQNQTAFDEKGHKSFKHSSCVSSMKKHDNPTICSRTLLLASIDLLQVSSLDAVAPLPLRRDCAMYPWTFKENLGRMWHMKVHRNLRTHSASWGLLMGGVLFYILLRQHDCSSASASFPKKVTQACSPCFHIRGYMSCSSPIFFSSAFTVQIAVFLLSAKVCFKAKRVNFAKHIGHHHTVTR